MTGQGLVAGQGCAGINVPPPTTPLISTIAGHELVAIPGGFSVIGSAAFKGATPTWVYVSPFHIGATAVSEDQYRTVMGKPGCEDEPGNHPVTMVSHNDALAYLKTRGGGLVLPTEAQWECAARGPAVNIRASMEEQGIVLTPKEIAAFIDGRYENLVFGVMGRIFNDPKDGVFKGLVEAGRPFFGWRVYATPSGRLSEEDVWFGRPGTTDVNWGPANAYGLKCMAGNAWEWMADWHSANACVLGGVDPSGPEGGVHRSDRGGSWDFSDPLGLRTAVRSYGRPDGFSGFLGFRVAAPVNRPGFLGQLVVMIKPPVQGRVESWPAPERATCNRVAPTSIVRYIAAGIHAGPFSRPPTSPKVESTAGSP